MSGSSQCKWALNIGASPEGEYSQLPTLSNRIAQVGRRLDFVLVPTLDSDLFNPIDELLRLQDGGLDNLALRRSPYGAIEILLHPFPEKSKHTQLLGLNF